MSYIHVVVEESAFEKEHPRSRSVSLTVCQLVLDVVYPADADTEGVCCFLR